MSCRASVVLCLCSILISTVPAAAADDAVLEQMVMLNNNALAAYRSGKHQEARGFLLDAEMLAETNGLTRHEIAARTYLHLGLVHLNGLKQREKALQYFAQGMQLRPNIRLTRSLARPNVRLAIAEAKRRQKQLLAAPSTPRNGGKNKEDALAASDEVEEAVDAEQNAEDSGAERGDDLLACPLPREAPPGQELEVRCQANPGLRAARAFLFFRSAGQKQYTALRMAADGKDGYNATIPADAINGRALDYYVEAESSAGDVIGALGAEANPKLLTLRRGASPSGGLSLARSGGAPTTGREPPPDDEPPGLRSRPADAVGAGRRRAAGAFWVGVGIGSGLGAHPTRDLEHHTGKTVGTGLSFAALHVLPELGIQYDDRLALSVQSRHQYILPSGGPDMTVSGDPPRMAHALLARVHYQLWGGEAFQLLGTATLGGGSGFRLKVPPVPGAGLPSSDTVAGGPLVVGPGASLFFNLSEKVLLAAELRMLIGFDKLAALGEGSLGVQYAF
jgi:hypothetical protein